jgi:hypothetical protein
LRGSPVIDLPALPGAIQTFVSAMNDDTVVVGASEDAQRITPAHVCKKGKAFDLNSRLDAESTGWALTWATAIDGVGAISGFGSLNGVLQAFLATPVK